MKVSVSDFKSAVSLFESGIISQMKKSANKFAMGIALASAGKKIDSMIAPFVGDDGMVDCDKVREYVDAGLAASGGELVIEPQIDPALKFIGVGIANITITRAEFDEFFDKTIPSVVKPLSTME